MRTSTTAAKTATLAMHAITQHALDHGLDTWRIEHPTWDLTGGILVAVEREHLDAWLDSVRVLDDPDVRRGNDETSRIEMVSYPALLPAAIGDVRITVVSSRPATTTPLQLVTTGSAS